MRLQSSKKKDDSPQKGQSEWIIPPGLRRLVFQFEEHCRLSDGQPVMIVGPTGIGKTLFLEIAKDIFQEVNKVSGNTAKRKVIEANCSHFGSENSDPNISRAELFGCDDTLERATYYVKDGYIQMAHQGLLILEELGVLPDVAQAMLLTFLESGKYRKVGVGKEEIKADVVVVGATNDEVILRPDLRYRFKPFYLPALTSHREDILYYMYYKYPDVVTSLKPWEVFLLLAYKWPGNIREIERVCFLIQREKQLHKNKSNGQHSLLDSNLAFVYEAGEAYSGLDLEKLLRFETEFLSLAPEVHEQFEEVMNECGLGISLTKRAQDPVFENKSLVNTFVSSSTHISNSSVLKDSKYVFVERKEFKRVWYFFRLLCEFIRLPVTTDADLIDLLSSAEFWANRPLKSEMTEGQIKKCLTDQPGILFGFDAFLESMKGLAYKDPKTKGLDIQRSIWSYSLDELKVLYYNGLHLLTNGDKHMASHRSGITEKTIKKYWERSGLVENNL